MDPLPRRSPTCEFASMGYQTPHPVSSGVAIGRALVLYRRGAHPSAFVAPADEVEADAGPGPARRSAAAAGRPGPVATTTPASASN